MPTPITEIPGIGPSTAETLKVSGFKSCEKIASSTVEALCAVSGFGPTRAKATIAAAKKRTLTSKKPAKVAKRKVKKTVSKPKPKKKATKPKSKKKKKAPKANSEKKSKKPKKPKDSKKAKSKSKRKSKKKFKKKK